MYLGNRLNRRESIEKRPFLPQDPQTGVIGGPARANDNPAISQPRWTGGVKVPQSPPGDEGVGVREGGKTT